MTQKGTEFTFCVFIVILYLFIDINLTIQTHSVPFCVILCHSVHKMAQNGTERVNKNAQNNNKGTKRHKMTQNENEKAKNSTELLKTLKKVIKWS